MGDTFADRFVAAKGRLSNYAISRMTGIADNLLGKYEGGSVPNVHYAAKIADALNVSLEWLATGRGEMRAGSSPESGSQSGMIPPVPAAEPIPPEFVLIPRLPIEASAGYGSVPDAEDPTEMLAFRREWLHRAGISATTAKAITVRGDSMEPTLRSGDVVLVDTACEWIDRDGIYVVGWDGRVFVKRIQPRFGGSLVLLSENPIYQPEEVPADAASSIRVIGRVRWYGRVI